jgi:diacylglycerol O-acyltransferase
MNVPVVPGDLTWLHMDRPNNLMYVHGLLLLKQVPDWDRVQDVTYERLVERFPVFGRRAVELDGTWVWQDDPDFSMQNHVRRVTLDAPGTMDDAQRYISSRLSEPFDFERPLWEVDLIDGVAGPDGNETALVLARFHHGIADGVRLVQVLLSLLDPMSGDALPTRVGRPGSRRGPASTAARMARHVATGTADFVVETGWAVTRSKSKVSRLHPRVVGTTVTRLGRPAALVDSVTGVASEDNKLANTWRSVGRLALSGRSAETVWSGVPGVEKKAAWISGLPLEMVRGIGREHGVTINEVLLAAVSLGVTEYLKGKGETNIDQLNWLIPVSLKPIEAEAPAELGNHFALVMLPMPLGVSDPARLLRELRTRMTRIKNSAEPALVYGVQRAIAETPAAVSVRLANLVANKAVGLLTNVPGPRAPMALAGTEVTGILGWVPTSGDQSLGLCIFSYNGAVSIGIAADAGLLPDPEVLAQCIERAAYRLADHDG